jgi:hypothetical protein
MLADHATCLLTMPHLLLRALHMLADHAPQALLGLLLRLRGIFPAGHWQEHQPVFVQWEGVDDELTLAQVAACRAGQGR